MKQNLDPRVFFSVVVVLLIAVGAMVIWIWGRPSAIEATTATAAHSADSTQTAGGNPRAGDHSGPTADQKKEIEEWKRTHPGATTKY